MLFNSVDFAIFLPVIFLLYWFVANKNLRVQNLLILISSYFFYGWWDWRFLSLIMCSTLVDYFVGLALPKQTIQSKRRALLFISIFINISLLGFFKYYNFFLDNFISAFSLFGVKLKANSLNIILPVGISFYTFQTLSYTIDIYRKKFEPTRNFIAFAAFVSFFPQLVSGPIERATNLLPQFFVKRKFDYGKGVDGLRQILWGLFKKIVIADNCAIYVDRIFSNYFSYQGSTLLLGAIFFAFQIYGDFSGYSDIAIGTARLLGFKLMRNFAFPYFSRDVAEFWRRWHISLSTWFRDYIYIPLGGSRGNNLMKVRNIFIIFIVSGLWHGANWTFIVWGALNAFYFLPLLLSNRNRKNMDTVAQGKKLPSVKEVFNMTLTFFLTTLAWIFFRAEDLGHAFAYLSRVFRRSIISYPETGEKSLIILIVFFALMEWIGREQRYAIAEFGLNWRRPIRWVFYYGLVIIVLFNFGKPQEFIYFQF